MIRCACSGCSAVVDAADDAAGSAVLCPKCGYLIQVPDPGAALARPAAAQGHAGGPAVRPSRRAAYILGGMHGLFVLCLPVALLHARDGSPACLVMFAVNLLLGAGSGFLFLAGMHTPDYLTDWLDLPFDRLRALYLLLPLSLASFAVALHVYHP